MRKSRIITVKALYKELLIELLQLVRLSYDIEIFTIKILHEKIPYIFSSNILELHIGKSACP